MSDVAQVLARREHIFLDFDGPVCDLFTSITVQAVKERLRDAILDCTNTLPDDVSSYGMFELMGFAANLSSDCVKNVESVLTMLEVAAASTAPETSGALDAMIFLRRKGHIITIVSNNSAVAVQNYVNDHGMSHLITSIFARTKPDPALLKPSPHLLVTATKALKAHPDDCLYIGDNVTDVQAAHAASMGAIGYDNRPGKRARLIGIRPLVVIKSMFELIY